MRCYDYYEPRCNHGSSLLPTIYSIMADELDKSEAYEFFRLSAYMDISDFKKNANAKDTVTKKNVIFELISGDEINIKIAANQFY